MAGEQTIIFPETDALTPTHEGLSANATLMKAANAYRQYMKDAGFSMHTVKAFFGDLRLLQNFFGPETPIHELGTDELNAFLYWLQYERGVPCSPKSYGRRVTTLKSFFGWLMRIKVLPNNPAAKLIHQRITTPLPTVLTDDEVDRLLTVTERLMNGPKRDARPHLLATLLLETGIKKAECMRLTPDDFDDSDPAKPTVLIRYQDPRQYHKERRLPVSADLMAALDRYLDAYKPTTNIFECTPRNLEYVLTDAATEANLPNGASFESLRWTSALRDFKDGMSADKLQTKMGLSKVTFRETTKKLEKLATGETEA